MAVSGGMGKISDPIHLCARGFFSGDCSGKLPFEFSSSDATNEFS